MKHNYKINELIQEINSQKNTFDIVRLVDPIRSKECILVPDKLDIEFGDYECYAVWEKDNKCKNCISAKALLEKTRYVKFEFVDNEIYFVVAKYVNVNGADLALELVTKVDSNIMLNGCGCNEFIDKINYFNVGIYIDELTGVYNRKYLHEKLPILLKQSVYKCNQVGLAIIDIDNFKTINDTYGHQIGDKIVMEVARLLQKNISERRGDFIVRFGGDEFIAIFNNITSSAFTKRLETFIYKARNFMVEDITQDMSTFKLSFSIGGVTSDEISVPEMKTMISIADKRLYHAKNNGKDQVEVCI